MKVGVGQCVAGGAYMPLFGMCATPPSGRDARAPMRVAEAYHAVIARRSQTSGEDACATLRKVKEKPQSLWKARLCATSERASSLRPVYSAVERVARNAK